MRVKISSDTTWFWKYGLVVSFAILASFFTLKYQIFDPPEADYVVTGIFFSFIIVICIAFKLAFTDLMDEVYDCGDFILVRNKGKEEYIILEDILDMPMDETLPRSHPLGIGGALFYLRRETMFGYKICFAARMTLQNLGWYAIPPELEDLKNRIEERRHLRNAMKAYEESHG